MAYQTILFDLDGTLTEPKVGITKSFAYALNYYGIHEDPENLTKVIGPPLAGSFMEFYGFDEKKAYEAVEKYREYYKDTGIFENKVYEGIPEMLKALRDAGKTLLVASSKPTVFVKRILAHFDIEDYFSVIMGSELDGRRVEKEDVVREALSLAGADPGTSVMVGDRIFDVEGAAVFGIPCVGVTWGYAEAGEFDKAAAVVNSAAELTEYLLRS